MNNLIYSKESYLLNGIFFDVQNDLGKNLQEKHYQKALKIKFIENKIPFNREVLIQLKYKDTELGNFYADFVVYGKIIVEVKTTPIITQDHIKQVLNYLESGNYRLGLIVNFRNRPLQIRRVINSALRE
jgi:GxxExxY protein